MDSYIVKMTPQAGRELDEIYSYIVNELLAVSAAEKVISEIEKAILGLNLMPFRGSLRRTGAFANKGYRQIHAGNFTIVYRINDEKKKL